MPFGRIHQLSPLLVDRIAAGEVIERPAAVVKELVENAIDAGASNIIVDVVDGGRELIRVIDDGGGIEPADLQLAFASHATSKLTDDEDLFRIGTMGFRGEALASIGAVSYARIVSRRHDAELGYEIFDRGGAVSEPQAAAANVGTTVEVRNLFYNVPARRKFIKGASTEYGHIADMVQRLALPYPDVSFRLTHNGRKSFDLPATHPETRLLSAWPDDFHEQRLPVDFTDAEVRLTGVIGLPELARPTAKHQYLYLNGRHIKDRFIQHALREAFRGLTEPGRHPAAILMLTIPPQDVDVNVHPTKIEVRFRDGGRIHGLVMAAVREKLLGSDLAPAAIPFRSHPVAEPPRMDMREKLADFFRQMPGNGSAPTMDVGPGVTTHGGYPSQTGTATLAPSPSANFAALSQFAPLPPMPTTREIAPSTATHFLDQPSNAPAIQLHNSYLIAQSDDGLVIIDQHALHERIMYEELLVRVTRGPLEAQRLLLPIVVPASSRQMALLEQVRPLLERLGIDAAPFGPDSVAVQSFPSFLEKLDPGVFLRELLERGEQELLDLHGEELLHEILDMMACKAAVKAGDPLTPAEIDALLARRNLIERSSNCPHGRPTTLRLSLRDLEKQFKRTGF